MELISMTDFVLEQDITIVDSKFKIVKYAQFLKQTLKLEMFVPCDDSEQAKEKVLFEGCSSIQQGENTIVIFNHTGIWYDWESKIIEDLIKENLILTQNAIKQFL